MTARRIIRGGCIAGLYTGIAVALVSYGLYRVAS